MKRHNPLTLIALIIYTQFLLPGILFSQDSTKSSMENDTLISLFNKSYLNYNQDQIMGLPFRNLSSFGLMAPSAYYLKGGDMNYYGVSTTGNSNVLDGMQISDISNLPIRIIDTYRLYIKQAPITSGFSSGGITSLVTLSDPVKPIFLFDISTNQAIGLQGYKGELYVHIPFGNKNREQKQRPSLLIAGSYALTNNNDPVWKGTQKLVSDKLQLLTDNPLRPSGAGSGTYSNSSFITAADMIDQKVPDNNGSKGFYPYVKIDFPISKNMNLSVGNYSVIDETDIYNSGNRIFNSNNNNVRTRRNFDNYLNFRHSFDISEDLKIGYNLNLQYSNYYSKIANPQLEDSFFDYGYVGKFTSYKMPTFELGSDTVDGQYYENVWVLNSWDYDTLVEFVPSNLNPDLSSYTSGYYDIYSGQPVGHYQNLDDIFLGGGLINGHQQESVYNMFNNTGYSNSVYEENNLEKFRASLLFEVDYGIHHILLGGEYNKESLSNYSIAPSGLWSLMRGLTNFHLGELDKDNPILVAYNGHVDTILYHRKYDANAQQNFDKNLRQILGLPIDGLEYIDIDSYDRANNTIVYYDENGVMKEISTPKDLLSLDMFSNDELLNDGPSYVNYSGYDYKGNKLKGKADPYSFFNDFSIGASEPQYWAAFIQDEFRWKNLHVQLGLRVDVYDANQPVLKDEYSLYQISDVNEANQKGELEFSKPENIGDDYSVYVDKVIDPTRVTGYRNGHIWYDEEGVEILDPSLLDVGSGISPYLKYPEVHGMYGDWEPSMTFEDYARTINLLPQVSIDYTLFKQLNIYTTYSSTTHNPSYYSRFRPEQYYYSQYRSQGIMSNSALKPTRNDRFFAGIKAAFFKKVMLDVSYINTTVVNFVIPKIMDGAYPINYVTFVNDPNSITTPGFEAGISYINNTAEGIYGGISYTQLFPEELQMSSFGVSDKVLNANLGYRFGNQGSNIFNGLSAIVYYHNRSGVPYIATNNGFYSHMDRTPSINMVNININKKFIIGQKASLDVYLIVENLFNFQNVFNVYSDTGDASDDGFLSDPGNQQFIENQLDPDSYRLLYEMSLYNTRHYDIPRIWRVGLTFRY